MPRKNKHFQLQGLDEFSDEYAIPTAINAAHRLLKMDDITTKQIIVIKKALNALGVRLDTTNEL